VRHSVSPTRLSSGLRVGSSYRGSSCRAKHADPKSAILSSSLPLLDSVHVCQYTQPPHCKIRIIPIYLYITGKGWCMVCVTFMQQQVVRLQVAVQDAVLEHAAQALGQLMHQCLCLRFR
jgi:hypothetical protein